MEHFAGILTGHFDQTIGIVRYTLLHACLCELNLQLLLRHVSLIEVSILDQFTILLIPGWRYTYGEFSTIRKLFRAHVWTLIVKQQERVGVISAVAALLLANFIQQSHLLDRHVLVLIVTVDDCTVVSLRLFSAIVIVSAAHVNNHVQVVLLIFISNFLALLISYVLVFSVALGILLGRFLMGGGSIERIHVLNLDLHLGLMLDNHLLP